VSTTNDVLAELRAERERLQKQLTELEVSSRVRDEKLKELEQAVKTGGKQPEPEEAEPTAEEVLNYVDQQINQVEAQLAKAEEEDPSSAPQLRKQLRSLERYYNDFKTQAQLMEAKQAQGDPDELVEKAVTEAQYKARFDATTQAILTEYEVLNKDSENYSEEMKAAVMDIYQPLISAGKDPTESLLKATTLVMNANGVLSRTQAAKLAEQQAAEKASAETAKPKPEVTERKKEAVARNVEAAKATPPNVANVGNPNDASSILDKYNPSKMSLQDFMKLSEDQEAEIERALALYDE